MTVPVISFDIDGVIAKGGYIPEWDRKPKVYEKLDLMDPRVPYIVNDLTRRFSVYIISARRFENALDTTRRWLVEKGFYLHWLCGVMCLRGWEEKEAVLRALQPAFHIDDAPRFVRCVPGGVLYYDGESDWPEARELAESGEVLVVNRWADIDEAI